MAVSRLCIKEIVYRFVPRIIFYRLLVLSDFQITFANLDFSQSSHASVYQYFVDAESLLIYSV